MPSEDLIEVFIAEDNELIRRGLKFTLRDAPGIKLVGEASDGRTTVQEVLKLLPGVVLMDIGLPFVDGIEATGEIKHHHPDIRVIMFTSHDADPDVFASFAAGADGYCLKEISPEQLINAIKSVASGVGWLAPGIAQRVLRASAQAFTQPSRTRAVKTSSGIPPLTEREIQVLQLLGEGLTNQGMAERLIVSIETVKTHMRHIMEKLAVSDRTQAALKALREGLI